MVEVYPIYDYLLKNLIGVEWMATAGHAVCGQVYESVPRPAAEKKELTGLRGADINTRVSII